MIGAQRGFLMLTSQMGNPERKPLTIAQFRTLTIRAAQMKSPELSRELMVEDLVELGYDRQMASRVVCLLQEEELLDSYLFRGKQADCYPVTRICDDYPQQVRQRLGLDAPGCLWAKGDTSLLHEPLVSLVGSRELQNANEEFASAVGREVARQGYVLVSGNAKGADQTAQNACLAVGGKVICVVADELQKYPLQKNVLYLSEDSFDLPFTPQRALSRNRVIHTLGYITLIAQCAPGTGGTWDGTSKNLRHNWSPVFCFDDGTHGMEELVQLGATSVGMDQLTNLSALHSDIEKFL